MNFELTRASNNEAPYLAVILTQAGEFKLRHDDLSWGDQPFTREEVEKYIEQGQVYIAYLEGKPIGTFSLQSEDYKIWGDNKHDTLYLHRLAISHDMHGQGFGALLLAGAEKETANQGKNYLRLDCDETNTGLCNYYEQKGYRKIGRRELPSDGSTYHAALYQKAV